MSHAPDFPEHFRYALRVAGPLLAIGVNSPFLPQRAVNRIAADPPLVPMNVDPSGRFDDAFRHFEHKHGTFWRWIQPVFDGPTPAAANARIEFRALPAQPTIRDSIAFVAAFAGLMESLPRREHPVASLDWEVARENFYAAMRDGRDAVLRWITANGEDTDDAETALTELLEHASDGLAPRGCRQARPTRSSTRSERGSRTASRPPSGSAGKYAGASTRGRRSTPPFGECRRRTSSDRPKHSSTARSGSG